ncbi:hypothetical protein BOX15_Mlig026153g1 [Macrostomum lignano]|uniref:EF-hand domain-containing protein n=1 Tax=Macrostomum lignano TaxID=282301 RepID=A0A267GB70_9PLAT|nr:hypothetical protein BOX15_Mlig026153g1 [Macrostomum lignano]
MTQCRSVAPLELDAESVAFLADASSLTGDQVRQLYADFKATQPSGSRSDFLNLLAKTHSSAELLRKKAHQFFELFDANKDHSISKDEVLTIMNTVFQTARDRGVQLRKTPLQVCEDFFKQLDTDRNCLISHQEFVEGVLTDPDLLRILQTPEVMETLGRWADS